MPYPTDVAAALSGATIRQLGYWRQSRGGRPPLMVPELRTANRVLYSFRDIVALRTFVFLREKSSLQKIRKAVQTLHDLDDVEHLSHYKLCSTDDDSIVWVQSDQDLVDLVARPGHHRLAVMQEVLDAFSNRNGEKVVALLHPRDHLQVDPTVRGGFPVIEGTRVPYDLVASLVEGGVPPGDVKQFYPGVSADAARDAHSFALQVERLHPKPSVQAASRA